MPVTSLSFQHMHSYHACMNSAKVIKLPSHCSSPSQCKCITEKRARYMWSQMLVSAWFSFRFYILTGITLQETRKAANIPGFEGMKTMVALCYIITVSSVSVQFASSSLPILSLVFSISPPFFRSLKAVSFCFFVVSPLCPLSSSFSFCFPPLSLYSLFPSVFLLCLSFFCPSLLWLL